jgi:putative transcriptional regulator
MDGQLCPYPNGGAGLRSVQLVGTVRAGALCRGRTRGDAVVIRNHLRLARDAAGLTQAELAATLGVSRQTVISLEQGRYLPSLELALRLARHFGQRVEDLFELIDVELPD